MGIVYNRKENKSKIGRGYKSEPICRTSISRSKTLKALTRKNIQFLKSLGLRPTSLAIHSAGK